jgi:FkbM family methyltransferase
MNVRDIVRRQLRRYGRAAVASVHERLDTVEQQHAELACSQNALLQSSIHLLGTQARVHAELEVQLTEIRQSVDGLRRMCQGLREPNEATRVALETSTCQAIESMRRALEESAELSTEVLKVRQSLDVAAYQVCIETSDYAATNPEVGLMDFLYSYLPTRSAIDVGAHVGDVSQHLLKAGYYVYAFEPYPSSHARLVQRINGATGFRAFNMALGSASGEASLHVVVDSTDDRRFGDASVFNSLAPHGMPEGLSFSDSVSVPVTTLDDLHRQGMLPADVSLVKIDTEGFDLEVIRGMGEHRYAVVVAEYWDQRIPFAAEGLQYTLDSLVCEMRQREYFWYIVVYRVWGENVLAFFCNHDRAVPHSWGNIFFFRDQAVFARAQQWCSAVLPRTYFKPVAARTDFSAADNEKVATHV